MLPEIRSFSGGLRVLCESKNLKKSFQPINRIPFLNFRFIEISSLPQPIMKIIQLIVLFFFFLRTKPVKKVSPSTNNNNNNKIVIKILNLAKIEKIRANNLAQIFMVKPKLWLI